MDTSGLIIFARSLSAQKSLAQAFEKKEIKKSSVIEEDEKKNKDGFKMDTTFLDID